MKFEYDDITFLGNTRFNNLPENLVSTLDPIATPSVFNILVFKASNTIVTVTNFLNGSNGQFIRILGDGKTTIKNNSNIHTFTNLDELMIDGMVYSFLLIDDIWYEDA